MKLPDIVDRAFPARSKKPLSVHPIVVRAGRSSRKLQVSVLLSELQVETDDVILMPVQTTDCPCFIGSLKVKDTVRVDTGTLVAPLDGLEERRVGDVVSANVVPHLVSLGGDWRPASSKATT